MSKSPETEIVKYSICDVAVILEKNPVCYRADICINKNDYDIENIGSEYTVSDKNGYINIRIDNMDVYSSIYKQGMLRIRTKWKSFHVNFHKWRYENLPNCIEFDKSVNDGITILLRIPKSKYIPKEWAGSYDNYMKRMKFELCDDGKRTSYVNNKHNADYSFNNIRKPFNGGLMRPK